MKCIILIIVPIFLLGCYGEKEIPRASDMPLESYIPDVGDNGWNNNKDILCPALDIDWTTSVNIWSDTRGVFISIRGVREDYDRDDEEELFTEYGGEIIRCYDECPVGTILFNDGNGWQEIYGYGVPLDIMKGIPNGELLFYGPGRWYQESSNCELYTVEDGEINCVAKGDTFIREIFAVNDRLAYALVIDGGVMKFDGESWKPLAVPPPRRLNTIWANEEVLFADGLSYSEEEWKVQETEGEFDLIWGFAADDVWAVNSSPTKIYHFDGKAWKTYFESWPFPPHQSCEDDWSQPHIKGIWGSDGVLYIFSHRQIARLESGKIDLILDLPCVEFDEDAHPESASLGIGSYWGNSKDELFVLVWDGSQYGTECGTVRAMFYNGTDWNWF
jgi:hypothetical protein